MSVYCKSCKKCFSEEYKNTPVYYTNIIQIITGILFRVNALLYILNNSGNNDVSYIEQLKIDITTTIFQYQKQMHKIEMCTNYEKGEGFETKYSKIIYILSELYKELKL